MELITLLIIPALLLITIIGCVIAMFKIIGHFPSAYRSNLWIIAVIGCFIGGLLAWFGMMALNGIYSFGYVATTPQALAAIFTSVGLLLWLRSIVSSIVNDITAQERKR